MSHIRVFAASTNNLEKNGEKLRNQVNELWRIFTAATSADVSHKTIYVFDALDECRENNQGGLIEKLQFFYHQTSALTKDTCLKFLDNFRAITDSFPHVHVKGEEENDRIYKEIDLVVKIRVKELAKVVGPAAKHRTYLWLYLAIDDIRTTFKRSLRPVESSITLIPPSVNVVYEKILSRVLVDKMGIVKKILEIIMAARCSPDNTGDGYGVRNYH
ncbi:hypothetical protein N7486_002820 [Penicillium sp. IBT 16267x]|nr:hypothetical protein N7486_002820 [Penicillium sp. IBT 16267x]